MSESIRDSERQQEIETIGKEFVTGSLEPTLPPFLPQQE
jgi:hypothetical protein